MTAGSHVYGKDNDIYYVDDILEIVKKEGIQHLTDHLNEVDETHSIQFTYEVEKEGSIPFLDILNPRPAGRKHQV